MFSGFICIPFLVTVSPLAVAVLAKNAAGGNKIGIAAYGLFDPSGK
jgi:hypothetical protein